MNYKNIYKPVSQELREVKELMSSIIGSGYIAVNRLSDCILRNNGKLLRPALLLLSSKVAKNKSIKINKKKLISVAAAIELLHTASLIHDDIIDSSLMRRHQPTLNKKFGDKMAVIYGDFLYTRALQTVLNYSKVREDLIYTVSQMCVGEVMQSEKQNDYNTLEKEYIDIVFRKSALLFGISCKTGAEISGANEKQVRDLYEYGVNLGIAYQIKDDMLDLFGKEEESGKTLGRDLQQGNMTLPLIYLKQNSLNLFDCSAGNIEKIIEKISGKINKYLKAAEKRLENMQESAYKKSMKKLLLEFKAAP